MKAKFTTLLALTLTSSMLAACGTTPNVGSADDRALLHSRAIAALDDFKRADPSIEQRLSSDYAYAIFPHVITGAIGVGGAHGNGEVYRNGRLVGYADMSQGSIGAQLGGQKFAELILFQNESTLNDFQHSTVEFDARASAVAASSGAASTAKYVHGVQIFTLSESGLMAQAAVGVQKFRYEAMQ